MTPSAAVSVFFAVVSPPFILFFALVFLPLSLSDTVSPFPVDAWFPLYFIIFIPLVLVLLVLRLRRTGRGVTVTADEQGVTWQRPGVAGGVAGRVGRTARSDVSRGIRCARSHA
jgi:hypothetical protein